MSSSVSSLNRLALYGLIYRIPGPIADRPRVNVPWSLLVEVGTFLRMQFALMCSDQYIGRRTPYRAAFEYVLPFDLRTGPVTPHVGVNRPLYTSACMSCSCAISTPRAVDNKLYTAMVLISHSLGHGLLLQQITYL